MGISRRQFITRTGLAGGGILSAGLWSNPLVQKALANTINDKYIVVLFMDGGNDGLNTCTPIDDGSYGTLRTHYDGARRNDAGGIRLSGGELLTDPGMIDASGSQIGLHPGLQGLKDLYDDGNVAVIQGCGYPDWSLSHDTSRTIWETADPSQNNYGDGWVGRHLADCYAGSDIPAVRVRSGSGAFTTGGTSVITLRRVRDFNFPFGGDDTNKRSALEALAALDAASDQPALANAGAAAAATLAASVAYPPLNTLYENDRAAFDVLYDPLPSNVGDDLREVAKIIYGVHTGQPDVSARYFEVRNGGYDTHSDQGGGAPGGRHYNLHQEVGDALKVFYQDIQDMGLGDKVLTVLWSEFSRRVSQNDNGTDHGSQGPMFVVGDAVNGGLYGEHPDIDPANLINGNSPYSQNGGANFRSTDFRDVYGTVLKHWLGVSEVDILSGILPLDGGDPNTNWTVNDFDLPFL